MNGVQGSSQLHDNSFYIFIIFGATSTNTKSIYKIFFMLNYFILNFSDNLIHELVNSGKDAADPRKWASNNFTSDSVVKKSQPPRR